MTTQFLSAFTCLLALLLFSQPVGAQRPDVVGQAKRSGIVMTEPLTLSFEWTQAAEGKNFKEVSDELLRNKFLVKTSVIKSPNSTATEHKLEAKFNGHITEQELGRVVQRLSQLTEGTGSVNWNITQTKR